MKRALMVVASCKTCPFNTGHNTGHMLECNIDGGVLPLRGTPKWCPLLGNGIIIDHKRNRGER